MRRERSGVFCKFGSVTSYLKKRCCSKVWFSETCLHVIDTFLRIPDMRATTLDRDVAGGGGAAAADADLPAAAADAARDNRAALQLHAQPGAGGLLP